MAEERKKSFMLYFDNFNSIAALPAEQRGELLLLLYRYAIAADKAPIDPEEMLEQYPLLNDAGRMAYRFLAETIRRDTEKWKDKQRRYQAAAARRWEARPSGAAGKEEPDIEDVAWMKPYIDQRDKP
ncbi:DUF6291 domain-containing protein [Dysosmobacter sp. Phy]